VPTSIPSLAPICSIAARSARPAWTAGSWGAEDRHHGVADELLDHAPVALDRLARDREVGILDRGHVLGIEAFGERREADDIGE